MPTFVSHRHLYEKSHGPGPLLFEDSSDGRDDDVMQDGVVNAVLAMKVGDMMEMLG